MDEMPPEFYQSIRHKSSFKNKTEYDIYLKEQIELWKKQSL